MEDELHDDLTTLLAAEAAVDDAWRVEELVKVTGAERTERVFVRRSDGREMGPYLRKTFSADDIGTQAARVWRALMEAQRAGRRFLHLPRVLACEESGEDVVVIAEWVEGTNLRELVAGTSPERREALASAVFPQLCDAVTELSGGLGATIVHRDVTPANVVCAGVGADGLPASVVLIDLGIAREVQAGQGSDTTHLGTVGYAAPEQYGFAQTDARTDVYALGMTLAYCYLGRDVTHAERDAGFAGEKIPGRVADVIVRATSFDPDGRYADARALRQAFDEAVAAGDGTDAAGEEPAADDTPTTAAQAPTAPSWRRGAIGLAAAAVVVALLAMLAWRFSTSLEREAGDASGSSAASASASQAADDGGDDDVAATTAEDDEPAADDATPAMTYQQPVVTEYGCAQDSFGTVWIGLAVTNPNDDVVLEYPVVTLVGTDADGRQVLVYEQTLMDVQPGQTAYFGCPTDCTTMPEGLSCSVALSSGSALKATGDGATFTCTELSLRDEAGGFTHFMGRIEASGAVDASRDVQVTVVLRDADGQMLCANSDYVTLGTDAQGASFDVMWADCPDYATWEAYATAW